VDNLGAMSGEYGRLQNDLDGRISTEEEHGWNQLGPTN